MNQSASDPLPEGVRLIRRDGDEPIELTIRAANANELAWRIHDLVPLIQSGQLARIIEATHSEGGCGDREGR